jgi:hypothetical protein
METWSTLHIFGYGETQLIGKDFNKKIPSTSLTTLAAVVNNVYSFKPEENAALNNYHAINIFNSMFADWQPKEDNTKSWRVEYTDLDIIAITALITEIETYLLLNIEKTA